MQYISPIDISLELAVYISELPGVIARPSTRVINVPDQIMYDTVDYIIRGELGIIEKQRTQKLYNDLELQTA